MVGWHRLVGQRYPIESGGFVDVLAQTYDGLEYVQHLLLVQQFPFLDLVFWGLVIRKEVFLVD